MFEAASTSVESNIEYGFYDNFQSKQECFLNSQVPSVEYVQNQQFLQT